MSYLIISIQLGNQGFLDIMEKGASKNLKVRLYNTLEESFDYRMFILGQLWKLINDKLVNKSKLWKPRDEWSLKPAENSMFYIENASKLEVLEFVDDTIIVEKLVENNPAQMWEIVNEGVANNEGYFTLKNSSSQKVLTVVSARSLEMKGIHFYKSEITSLKFTSSTFVIC